MRCWLVCGAAFLALAAVAWAGAPPDVEVQGLYEGACKDAKGECKLEARVVAQGKGAFKVFIRQTLADGKIANVNGAASAEGDSVAFTAKAGDVEWKGTYANAAFTGTCGEGCTLELKRVQRKSPTLGKKPPEGAVVLLDGKTFDFLAKRKKKDGTEDPWPKAGDDGSIQVARGGMSSTQALEGSFNYHVEFLCPFMPDRHSQGRGNSGVFLPNGDEIQVLDSFGDATYLGGGCGGIYKYKDPDTMEALQLEPGKPEFKFNLSSLPPLEWQTYDIEYRVAKQDGKIAGKPRVTVYHNGIKIHDNFEVKGNARKATLRWQDHGCAVRYRNIWVQPVDNQ
ncbi:MAG TPA: DUF1080 domain-containing protein [Planctomycetota bacterium]|nr:DUF1080 domain-containing protein [Planctomycetota bacterium]